jgi:hypothetical protein
MKKPVPPRLKKLAPAKQRRMDELLEKNSEGTITPKEKVRLEQLVAEAEQLMAANARQMAEFAAQESKAAPPSSVPVTVWIQPEHARR